MRSAKSVPKNPKQVAPGAPGGGQYWLALERRGREAGLDAVGVARAQVLNRARAAIEQRIADDLVNSMKFTFLRPDRSTNLPALVEGARSVIVGARSYAHGDPAADGCDDDGPLRARIARYAWSDHYGALKESLNAVAAMLRRDGHRATVFADDNSVVDREVAHLAGIGWYGRNANILIPGKGSMFVLGCVVTTADLPPAGTVEDGCGTCQRCVPACPTAAIVGPGVIDANRCLSWLLQKPGVFDPAHRAALGDRIYGCDDCQTVCPPTRRNGWAPVAGDMTTSVMVLEMLGLSDAELDRRCEGWYVDKRDMRWVRRNLLIVLGNRADGRDPEVESVLRAHLSHADPYLRAHATWAAARLGRSELLFVDDPDPMVQDELARLPSTRDDS